MGYITGQTCSGRVRVSYPRDVATPGHIPH
jgi:hypothetical protein